MEDSLLESTLRPSRVSTSRSATLPCLTVLGHVDRARLGDRALLKGLAVGQRVEVSRAQPKLGRPGTVPSTPLADPSLSRTPFFLSTDVSGGLELDPNGLPLRAEGRDLVASATFTAQQLERGVVLELSDRVLLLLHASTHRPLTALPGLLGQSDAIEDLRCEIVSVADLETPVLIRGETGTGKELVAQVIHALSTRRSAPYVPLNMAAVSEATAVSMLFGHAKGAFTGALQRREGIFDRADGGTLLLDEIGETPESVQNMLLRAIETKQILPLGDASERAVDVRFLAATDADLERELEERSFSAALLHRLAGYEIHVPPLRARREDIPQLLMHFIDLELTATDEAKRSDEVLAFLLSSRFLARIVRHSLPGNVRQLRNVARHLVIANRGKHDLAITKAVERALGDDGELPLPKAPSGPRSAASTRSTAAISDERLLQALREAGWSPTRAAATLGIANGTLHDLMRRSSAIRRAADLSDEELRSVYAACSGDTRAMADRLCVSERGLRTALRQRGLFEMG
jgi:two-component system nitrogen regulation response regulator GlnG